jgi:eukaryotic-like serine/threonine-protein kinase
MDSADSTAGAPLYRFRFGAAEFDESLFELSLSGLVVDIEPKPLEVLAALLRDPGKPMTREELLRAVWADRITVEQVLTNAVAKLRKALGEADGTRIATVPRGGYRFRGPVERIAIGTRLASHLDFTAGGAVPGRENFELHTQLAGSKGAEIWLAKHRKTNEPRVYKFARDAEHLSALKREATLYRLLREALGEREDLLRIIDWNFEASPFFLECEYGGDNLLRWAGTSQPLIALSRPDRIALFLQVADAVAAAHSVGVLHKDLKPTNVLIVPRTGGGMQARVADFGSGRLMEPERLEELGITRLGMTVTQGIHKDSGSGTLLYLAPELIAGGSPTVQSDLFSLGLMLYQIVNGDLKKPIASGWEQDIGDDLLAEDITAAIHGDPARRLSSVAELSQRLRMLEARRSDRESARMTRDRSAAAERALERARIRRPWIITALVVLLVSLGISYNLYRRERLSRLEAERAAIREETTNRFLSEDLLGAADPTGPGGAHNPTIKEVLARTANTLEARFPRDPDTKASVELALGTAYFGLTDYTNAEKYRRDALKLLTGSQGADSPAAIETEYQLASILAQTNRLDEAATMLDHADGLAGARLAQNSRLAFQAHWTRAGYYKVRMAAEKALIEYSTADRIRAAIDPDNDNMLVRLHDGLSWCYVRLGRATEAVKVLTEIMSPRYTPDRVGPVFWSVARIDDAIALMSLQRYAEAEQLLADALQELRRSVGPDHFFVGYAQNELGELYTRRSEWDAAAVSLREAYRIFSLRTGEHGQATLTAGANLGIIQYRTGQSADAVKTLEHMRAEFIRTLGESSPQVQIVAFYLACAQQSLRNYNDASTLVAHLDPAQLADAEPRDDWKARLMALQGAILLGQGRKAEARALLEPAVAEMQKDHTPVEDLRPFERQLAASR